VGEDVWLREAGVLHVSAGPAQDAAVTEAAAAAAELGVPEEAVPLSADEVAARCSSPVFRRGVFFPSAGTVQPARLVRALRREAVRRGVRLHEGTGATRIEDRLVETPGGRVRARDVVVATNAWMTGWRPV